MTGNYRKRVKGKGAIRIKKGSACEVNPIRNRYRRAALAARNATLLANRIAAVDDRLPEDINLNLISLNNNFSTDVESSESISEEEYQTPTQTEQRILKEEPEAIEDSFTIETLLEAFTTESILQSFTSTDGKEAFCYALLCLQKLFKKSGEQTIGPEFSKIIQTLAELRQNNECFCRQEIDFTIGAAVRYVGVAAVLDVLPLGINVDAAILSTDFSQSWLIPIIRVNLTKAPLSLFTSFFLPMAIKIYKRLPNLEPLQQKTYTTLQRQFWELLPAFCESPSDLEKSFDGLAPILGAALTERKDLRLTILTALRRVIMFALQPKASNEHIEVVSRYSKNFMPLMFNLYTSPMAEDEYDDRGVRLAILETVRLYVELTPQELLERFVDSAISKLKETESEISNISKQNQLLDILCALSRSADSDNLEKILNTINPWFVSSSIRLQKKSYKILEEVLSRRSAVELEGLFNSREEDIENALYRSYESILPPSRASVLASMRFLQANCSNSQDLVNFTKKSLDTIICSLDKENNTKTRSSASKLLQIICSQLIEIGNANEQTASFVLSPIFDDIFQIATAETSTALPSTHSILVAMNIMAQKYVKLLNGIHSSQLVSQACSYLTDGRAPIRILAIRLIRILVQKMSEVAVQQYREVILNTVFEGQPTADPTNKVKKANRLLLEVLMDKFGIEILMKYTIKPEWVKQMKNIEKTRRRKNIKNKEGRTNEDSHDDAMSCISKASSKKTAGADTILEMLEDSDQENYDSEAEVEKKSQKSSVWLKDDDEGEITDLLDRRNMIGRLVTTDPALMARKKAKALEKKKDYGFKFTAEGKMIILDDEDAGRKRKGFDVFGDEDTPKSKARKQKTEESDDSLIISDNDTPDSNVEARSAVSNWRPGGKGIHRDTKREGSKAKTATGGKKVLPYAYLPLRQKGVKEDVRKILKAKRKDGKMSRLKAPISFYKVSIRCLTTKEKLKSYVFPELKTEDCEQKYISGWGPGGQKVNTAQNAVQLRHLPTGIVLKVHESRLLSKNIDIAFERMKHALDRHFNGDNCYEDQFKRLEREREKKANKKRQKHREEKEIIKGEQHPNSLDQDK